MQLRAPATMLAIAVALAASPALAATHILNLTGTVASGTTATVDFGGQRFDFFSIPLQGLSPNPLTLAAGDEIQAMITLDQSLTVPAALTRNLVDLIILNSISPTSTTTSTSGNFDLFNLGSPVIAGPSGASSSNQVAIGYYNPAGNSFTFDSVQTTFTIDDLGDPTLDVDYPLLRFATVNPLAAVPEPSTWATMLLGMFAVGWSMRRQRRGPARVRFAF